MEFDLNHERESIGVLDVDCSLTDRDSNSTMQLNQSKGGSEWNHTGSDDHEIMKS
jgi:hypothetical protein